MATTPSEFLANMTEDDRSWLDYFALKYTKDEIIAKYIMARREMGKLATRTGNR